MQVLFRKLRFNGKIMSNFEYFEVSSALVNGYIKHDMPCFYYGVLHTPVNDSYHGA
jgi:hypothetical protein